MPLARISRSLGSVNSVLNTQEFDTDRVLTIPNVISFLRLLSVAVFGVLIVLGMDLAAVVLLVVFGGTDWLDGFLARRLKQRSPLGAKLDPVADRLYIVVAVLALAIRDIVPWWLLAILVLRDVMLTLLLPTLKRLGRDSLPVNMVGKAATMFLLLAFPMLLIGYSDEFTLGWMGTLGWVFAIVGSVLYWAAGSMYVRATRLLVHQHRTELT